MQTAVVTFRSRWHQFICAAGVSAEDCGYWAARSPVHSCSRLHQAAATPTWKPRQVWQRHPLGHRRGRPASGQCLPRHLNTIHYTDSRDHLPPMGTTRSVTFGEAGPRFSRSPIPSSRSPCLAVSSCVPELEGDLDGLAWILRIWATLDWWRTDSLAKHRSINRHPCGPSSRCKIMRPLP